MSKALARRRRSRSNPAPTTTTGNVVFAIGALAIGAGVGGLLSGAPLTGVALTGGAGLVTAAVSPTWRGAGITTAGLGLGALLAASVVSALAARKTA